MRRDVEKYTQFGLTRDMLEVPEILRKFDADRMEEAAREIADAGRLLLTGEGSSRIFPAKNAIATVRREGWPIVLHTEAGRQSQEYDLREWAVLASSNSGRTAEVIALFDRLVKEGHSRRYSLTAFSDSRLESLANRGYVLGCGPEGAVAATKSVFEQALFYRALLEHVAGRPQLSDRRQELADAVQEALTLEIDPEVTQKIASARSIYWVGRNDGVAEELTLKTNEITRKPADFLEGTYAVHGIEEVMDASDVVLWVDPYPDSEEKFDQTLQQGVGLTIVAISSRPTRFPTLVVPEMEGLNGFVQMAAGWNVLVEVGLSLGINVDKPVRARKVGNEFTG